MSKEKVTKDKFFEFLDDVLFIRKEYKDGKWPTVTAQERDVIYSIYTEAEDDKDIEKDMENACAILEPIYMKYKKQKEIKSTERTPKEIVQAIYFIIMRDYIKRLKADEKKLKANGSKVKDLKILSEDGKLRRYIQTDSTNETFIKLGEKSSRLQERMGIRPRKDFTDLYYEPVGFRSIKERGKILREMILSILFQLEYPMLIDLSGDNTILEDIYYCDTEVIYCSDSNAANFYNALKFQYTEFSRYVIESVRDMDDDIEETVKDFERILKERKINGREEYDEKCSKSIMKKIASQEMHNPRTLLTYPAEYNAIDIDLAYKYFFVKWMKDKNESLEQVKEQLAKKLPQEVEWLQMRIEKAYIAWGSIEDFFTKINGYPTDIISLAKNASGQVVKSNVAKTFYENLNDTVERKKVEKKLELAGKSKDEIEKALKQIEKNKDPRIKKGVLFYDYSITPNLRGAVEFLSFINKNDCSWIFVCDKSDVIWRDMFKDRGRYLIELNDEREYKTYIKDGISENKTIITNIKVKGFLNDKILEKNILGEALFEQLGIDKDSIDKEGIVRLEELLKEE